MGRKEMGKKPGRSDNCGIASIGTDCGSYKENLNMQSLELTGISKPMCIRGKQNSSQTYKDTEIPLPREIDCPEVVSMNIADSESHGNALRKRMIGNRRFKYASDSPMTLEHSGLHPPRPPPKKNGQLNKRTEFDKNGKKVNFQNAPRHQNQKCQSAETKVFRQPDMTWDGRQIHEKPRSDIRRLPDIRRQNQMEKNKSRQIITNEYDQPFHERELNRGQRQYMATDTESLEKDNRDDNHMHCFKTALKKEHHKRDSTGPQTVPIRQRTGIETPEFVETYEIYDIKGQLSARDLLKKCAENQHVSDEFKENKQFQEHKFNHGQERYRVPVKEAMESSVDDNHVHHYQSERKELHVPNSKRPKTAPINQRKKADPSDQNNFAEEFDKLLENMPSTEMFDKQQETSESVEKGKKYNVNEQLLKRNMWIEGQTARQLASDEHKDQKKNVQGASNTDIFVEDLEQTGMSPTREKQSPSEEYKNGFDLQDFQDGHEENVHHQFKECSGENSLNTETNGKFRHQQSEYISTVPSSFESMDILNDNENHIHGVETCIGDNNRIVADDQDRNEGIDKGSTTLGISDVKTTGRPRRLQNNQEEKMIDQRQSDDKSNVTVNFLNTVMPSSEVHEELGHKELKTAKHHSSVDVQEQKDDSTLLLGLESGSNNNVSDKCTSDNTINTATISENQTDSGKQERKNTQREVTNEEPEVCLHMDRQTLNISTTTETVFEANEDNEGAREQHIQVNKTNLNDDDDDDDDDDEDEDDGYLETSSQNQQEFSLGSPLHDKQTMDTLTVISRTKKDASNRSSSDEKDMMDTPTPILPNQNNASNSQLSDGKHHNDTATQIDVNNKDVSNSPPSDDYDKMHSQKSRVLNQNNASNRQSIDGKHKMDTPKQINLGKADTSNSPSSYGKDMMETLTIIIPNKNNSSNYQSCDVESKIDTPTQNLPNKSNAANNTCDGKYIMVTPSQIHVNKTNASNGTSYDDKDIIDSPTPIRPNQNNASNRHPGDDKDKMDTLTQILPNRNNVLNSPLCDCKDTMHIQTQIHVVNKTDASNLSSDTIGTPTINPLNQNNCLKHLVSVNTDEMHISIPNLPNENGASNSQSTHDKDTINSSTTENPKSLMYDNKVNMDTPSPNVPTQNVVSNSLSPYDKDNMGTPQPTHLNKTDVCNSPSSDDKHNMDTPQPTHLNKTDVCNSPSSDDKDNMDTPQPTHLNKTDVCNSSSSDDKGNMDTPQPTHLNKTDVCNSPSSDDKDNMDTPQPTHLNKTDVCNNLSSDDKVIIETPTTIPQNQTNASNSQDTLTILNHSNNDDSSKRLASDNKGEMQTPKQNLVNQSNASNSQSVDCKDRMDTPTPILSSRNNSSKHSLSKQNPQNKKRDLNCQSPQDKDKTDIPKTNHLNTTIAPNGLSCNEKDELDTSSQLLLSQDDTSSQLLPSQDDTSSQLLPSQDDTSSQLLRSQDDTSSQLLPSQDDTSNSLVSDHTVFTQNSIKSNTNNMSNSSLLDDKHNTNPSKIITPNINNASHNYLQEKHKKDSVKSTKSNKHDSSNSISPCTEQTTDTQNAIYNATNKSASYGITSKSAKDIQSKKSESSNKPIELKEMEPRPSSNTKLQKKQESNDLKDHWTYRRKRPIQGIPNVGNTCFANSILQVLGQTPELTARLKSSLETKHMTKGDSVTECLLLLIQQINQGSQQSGRGIIGSEVERLLKRIFTRDNSFSLGRQNDSHSFMLTLFEALLQEEGHAAVELFEGYSRNIFKYDCGHEDPAEKERFTSILVPVTSTNRTEGLEVIMEERFDESVLRCSTCKQEKPATRVLTFENLPKILVIQLGTFREVIHYGRTTLEKENSTITYKDPMILRSASDEPVTYHLYGIVSHSGSLQGGHYTADVKCQSQWYHCSDEFVKETKNRANKSDKGAFLLFYSQRPTLPT